MRPDELEQCGMIMRRALAQLRCSLDVASVELTWLLGALEQTEMELPWDENGSPPGAAEDGTIHEAQAKRNSGLEGESP